MQAIVEKVMRALTIKHPVREAEAKLGRGEATAFAAELLENYKNQIARRSGAIKHRQEQSGTARDAEN
jgi:hypothetical protein